LSAASAERRSSKRNAGAYTSRRGESITSAPPVGCFPSTGSWTHWQVERSTSEMRKMSEDLTCPICGGLHPAGHRDKELEDQLEAVRNFADKLEKQGQKTHDIFEKGFCLGIAEKLRAVIKEYLEEATKEVEVNEYGEIVSKRENEKGVKLKPHTFYGPKWVVELLDGLDKDQLKELLGAVSLIVDPLGQELIKRAASEGP